MSDGNPNAAQPETQTALLSSTQLVPGNTLTDERRGLLDIQVQLSNSAPTAGSEFTVFVEVTNPFDVPIYPRPPQLFLPRELRLVELTNPDQHYPVKSFNELLQDVIGERTPVRSLFTQRISLLPRSRKKAGRIEDTLKEMAEQTIDLENKLKDLDLNRRETRARIEQATAGKSFKEKLEIYQKDETIQVLMDQDTSQEQLADEYLQRLSVLRSEIVAMTGSTAVFTEGNLILSNFSVNRGVYIQAKGNVQLDRPIIDSSRKALVDASLVETEPLQPGNTAVYSGVLITTKNIFFRPIRYDLECTINFAFDPSENARLYTNAVQHTMTVRASVGAVMIGALVGGISGFLAASMQAFNQPEPEVITLGINTWSVIYFSLRLLLTVILSMMAVVFLARKSETQSLVSIEDFWGGLVIGFLVGYTGTSAFEGLTGVGGA
jgi:hypothetical protein